jgi:succinate dehydrogenase / fumarate reductase, cytochrome b subunit
MENLRLPGRIWRSSLGKKYLMALSGVLLFLFAVGHMVGNLQVFLGPEAINRYGYFLQHTPELLWPARLGLLVLVTVHIAAAVTLALQNQSARGPVPYSQYEAVATTYAGRTMLVGGLIVAAFVIFHILHFTVQTPAVNLTGHDFKSLMAPGDRHDIYGMMVLGFRQPVVSAFYVLGVGLLCLHLSHGVMSLFQSLGLTNPFYLRVLDRLAVVVGLLLFAGYCSIPAAVLLGLVK